MKRLKNFRISYIALMMAVVMVGSMLTTGTAFAASKSSSSGADYTEGDKIYFGTLDGYPLYWTVLTYDSSTGVGLVVAKDPLNTPTIVDYRAQLSAAQPDWKNRAYVNWENNSWREWLNSVFYNYCFTADQQKNIQKANLTKAAAKDSLMNFFHDTTLDAAYIRNGSKNSMDLDIYNTQSGTSDYIFFLSSDEYTEYKDTMSLSTGWAVWPLRTNAYDNSHCTLCVDETNSNLIDDYYTYENNSIRPAMYVKLKDIETESSDTTNSSTTSKSSSSSTSSTTSSTSSSSSNTSSTSSTSSSSSSSSSSSANVSAKGASASTVITRRSYANNATDVDAATGKKISLPDDSSCTLSKNGQAQVAIDLSYLNGSNKKYTVTYTTSDTSVFTVDSSGKLTAGSSSGTATLSVRMKKSNGKIYNMSCRINVK